jgi:hypothetical protein
MRLEAIRIVRNRVQQPSLDGCRLRCGWLSIGRSLRRRGFTPCRHEEQQYEEKPAAARPYQ